MLSQRAVTEVDEPGSRISEILSPKHSKRALNKFNKSILDTIVNGCGEKISTLTTKNTVFPVVGVEA